MQAQLRRLPDAGLGLHAAGPDLLAYPVDGALAVPVHRAHERSEGSPSCFRSFVLVEYDRGDDARRVGAHIHDGAR